MAPFDDLALPRPGSDTLRTVLSLALRRALAELVPALHPRRARGAVRRRELGALCTRLADVGRREPGALAQALRQPTVGTLLRCLRQADEPGAGDSALALELALTLGTELAAARALGGRVELTLPPGARPRVCALGLGAAWEAPADTRRIVLEDGVVRHELAGRTHELALDPCGVGRLGPAGEPWLEVAYLPVAPGTALALRDNNPLALLEAHPDKAGSGLDLGGRTPEAWVAALGAARELVAEVLPELARELALAIPLCVPVGCYVDRHLSASYREALGIIYLSLHPSPLTMAEALVHELSHNKLHALFEHDELLVDDAVPRHPSARRPDPRPLRGVLLALHAFAPVAELYARLLASGHPLMADVGARTRLATIVGGNRADLDTLRSAMHPTAVGAALLEELERVVGATPAPPDA
ncbi:MAG: hypothetical protein IT373_29890 [Polyangiaceae bacterium]|nr:hypothetical protein [Polyangiaceae bacterium]